MIEIGTPAWHQLAEQQRLAALAEPVKEDRQFLLAAWCEEFGRVLVDDTVTVPRRGPLTGTLRSTLLTEADR